jgi:DNA-binding response OmpR family regulator|tara:strand:- start:608 stop:979 length:372 start_codon:yes stop_codon:yes gene_type:complete
VVDDNEMNRDMLGRRLQRQGYRVTMAVDGRQALEFIKQEPFDLVLLDIMLPVMNGYEVLEHLKADQSLSHIPVIITTALDESDGKAKCMELGAEDYLTKPFNPVILKSRISDCLERHHRAESG